MMSDPVAVTRKKGLRRGRGLLLIVLYPESGENANT